MLITSGLLERCLVYCVFPECQQACGLPVGERGAQLCSVLSATTICACATALPAHTALIRLSGTEARYIARRADLPLPEPWCWIAAHWPIGGGRLPVRVLYCLAPRSFTGEDLVEIAVPGSRAVVDLVLATLQVAGAVAAEPGGFARRALASGRLTLDRAEALLAVATAPDAAAAARAIGRLRGALADELEPVRMRLIELRASVEAGLDFAGEDGISSFDPQHLRQELSALRAVLARWRCAANDLGNDPVVCLVGPANAGKSALFARLTGAPALISPIAGTTRDPLEAMWHVAGRPVRLVDTAGWLAAAGTLDAQAMAAGTATLAGAAVIIACSAPDAPCPLQLPDDCDPSRCIVVATKSDLGMPDPRAVVAVSTQDGEGLVALAGLVGERLGMIASGEPRQQRLLAVADATLAPLVAQLPEDVLLADDLRRAADALGEVLGATTSDEVMNAIFGRFCIGK